MRLENTSPLQRTFFLVGALIAAAAVHGHASAQQPPDVVELEDGSIYRGTIAELVANDHVSIVTVTGDTRTFEISEVKFAGPAFRWESQQRREDVSAETSTDAESDVDEPSPETATESEPAPPAETTGPTPPEAAPPPRPPVSTGWGDVGAMVSFRASSDEEDARLTFFRRGRIAFGTGGHAQEYIPICTTPCSATVPRDNLTLGIAPPGSTRIRGGESIDVHDGMLIEGQYGSSTVARVMTWILIPFGVVGLAGIVIGAVGASEGGDGFNEDFVPLILGGAVVAAGGLVGGIALAISLDGTHIEVVEPR